MFYCVLKPIQAPCEDLLTVADDSDAMPHAARIPHFRISGFIIQIATNNMNDIKSSYKKRASLTPLKTCQAMSGLRLAVLLMAGLGMAPVHSSACINGFDVGSSGIRIGSTTGSGRAKVNINYLEDVWVDKRIDTTIGETLEAFKTLPDKAGLPKDCVPLAGGYSVWRMAAEQGDLNELANTLKHIQTESGVYLLVIPQDIEGRYAHEAVGIALGDRLRTPYILDIGGGSLQIATADNGWGTALGQRSWSRVFCENVKHAAPQCLPNPVGQQGAQDARQALLPFIGSAKTQLGTGLKVTAISKPVAMGLLPIMNYMLQHNIITAGVVEADGFDRTALEAGIAALAELDDDGILKLLEGCTGKEFKAPCQKQVVSPLVTDMLLLRGLMEELDIQRLEVAQADITNVDGIMADPQAMAWSKHFDCYLEHLKTSGIKGYFADPNQCPIQESEQVQKP